MKLRPSFFITQLLLILNALIVLVPTCSFSQATEVEGFATVVDGDTLKLAGYRIRLAGIDAPELKQKCEYLRAEWSCGLAARNNLIAKIGGFSIRCELDKKDLYQRFIATCFLGAEDLNAWMVLNGYALSYGSYSKKYLPLEEEAKEQGAGIWPSTFDRPQNYRRTKKKL